MVLPLVLALVLAAEANGPLAAANEASKAKDWAKAASLYRQVVAAHPERSSWAGWVLLRRRASARGAGLPRPVSRGQPPLMRYQRAWRIGGAGAGCCGRWQGEFRSTASVDGALAVAGDPRFTAGKPVRGIAAPASTRGTLAAIRLWLGTGTSTTERGASRAEPHRAHPRGLRGAGRRTPGIPPSSAGSSPGWTPGRARSSSPASWSKGRWSFTPLSRRRTASSTSGG